MTFSFSSRFFKSQAAPLCLSLFTLISAWPGLIHIPPLDRDESRFAQASKQMLETGDFIEIRYQEEGRNKKPAGIHWLQAGTTALFSSAEAKEIWSYRLPSLFGAMLAVWGTYMCGRILLGARPAFFGAGFFSANLLLTSEAHIAKTDGMLVGLTCLAMAALAWLYRTHLIKDMPAENGPAPALKEDERKADPEHTRLIALLFWAFLGLSFLIKGPVTLMVAGLTLLVLGLMHRRMTWASALWNWRGPVLFALIVLPWFIWVQWETAGAFLDGAVGKDLKDKFAGASEGHGGPPGYHALAALLLFFPATLFLLPSLGLTWQAVRQRGAEFTAREQAGLLFLIAWAGPNWLFFELLPTKLVHYILPVYPALSLICGWGFYRLLKGAHLPRLRAASLLIFLAGAGAFIAILSPSLQSRLQIDAAQDFQYAAMPEQVLAVWQALPSGSFYALILGGILALIAAILYIRHLELYAFWAVIGTSILLGWQVRSEFLPNAVWIQPSETAHLALAEVCAVRLKDKTGSTSCSETALPDRVHVIGYAEPSLVFSLGTQTLIPPRTRLSLPESCAGSPKVYLINLEEAAGRAAKDQLEAWTRSNMYTLTGSRPHFALNYSNGDPVAFQALRIEKTGCSGKNGAIEQALPNPDTLL